MVKVGGFVDVVINELKFLLEEGDMIIDGGNFFYEDMECCIKDLEVIGLGFVGMGVSGGEEGVLLGFSLMFGGILVVYKELEFILIKIVV